MAEDDLVVVVDPGGTGFYIERLWAFLAVHGDGDEGVIGLPLGGMTMPAIAADSQRVEQMRPMVEQLCALTKKQVKLVRFDRRVDIETFGPTDA